MTEVTASLKIADADAEGGFRPLAVADLPDPAVIAALAASLTALLGQTDQVEGPLAAILAKLSADPASQTTLAAVLAKMIAAPSTEAKQDTANTSLASILAKITSDPATQTTLAAVLAKLSSDPATQTTLAAVLAKISSDPATQTSLAALISANHTDLAAILAKNEAIRALLAGTLLVERRRASKGYQQVTSTAAAATLASLCSGAAIPAGATGVEMIPSAQVRITDDGTAPSATLGEPVTTAGWDYDRDLLSAVKVYGAATIDLWFYA